MEHKTGIEDHYIIKNNRKLRFGYTTGTCAAAAAQGAAVMLFSGQLLSHVKIMTPKGIGLDLLLHNVQRGLREDQLGSLPEEAVPEETSGEYEASGENNQALGEHRSEKSQSITCAVRKDGGDDPDVTDGILIYATVFRMDDDTQETPSEEKSDTAKISAKEDVLPSARILVEGGCGVGRVTRSGMQRPVGEAAINPVPLQMIQSEVEKVCADFEYTGRLKVVITIPAGERIAAKTFNPRLGIEGGISVLGTSGIVVPMSEEALLASIRLEMEMLVSRGKSILVITPGNYGETFTRNEMTIDLSSSMKCSNFVGETLDMAVNLGVQGVLFVAHIGKFIKVAGGIMNTHSRDADCRAELMAAFALRAGAERACAMRILESATTDEALEIMEEAGIRQCAMELAAKKVRFYLQHRVGGAIRTEAVLFSGAFGYLTQTEGAEDMIRALSQNAG